MMSPNDPEPDPIGSILRVGQDAAGHWLVQDDGGKLEGRFVSRSAAIAFARSESHSLPGATIMMAVGPLVPTVSFAPVAPWENARNFRKAA